MPNHINANKASVELSSLINRAGDSGERFIIEDNGKALAAIVGFEDFEKLEALEYAMDSALLSQAIKESEGSKSLSLEEVLACRGLNLCDLENESIASV